MPLPFFAWLLNHLQLESVSFLWTPKHEYAGFHPTAFD
ncbi:hypothetical protein SPLC1_S205090 [Arthrospira platensis C1]|nr:hypothetical protein SPLC1_S205090 [Arthrospira platensis C1]